MGFVHFTYMTKDIPAFNCSSSKAAMDPGRFELRKGRLHISAEWPLAPPLMSFAVIHDQPEALTEV